MRGNNTTQELTVDHNEIEKRAQKTTLATWKFLVHD